MKSRHETHLDSAKTIWRISHVIIPKRILGGFCQDLEDVVDSLIPEASWTQYKPFKWTNFEPPKTSDQLQ